MAMVTTATDIKFNTVWMFLINLHAPPEAEVKSSAAIPTAGAKNAAATQSCCCNVFSSKAGFFLDLSVFHLKFPMFITG